MSPVEVYMALRLQLEAQLGREQTTRAGTMILLGQMALETGRFEATMNYNFGGVKCSPNWKGCWQHFATTEHVYGLRESALRLIALDAAARDGIKAMKTGRDVPTRRALELAEALIAPKGPPQIADPDADDGAGGEQ